MLSKIRPASIAMPKAVSVPQKRSNVAWVIKTLVCVVRSTAGLLVTTLALTEKCCRGRVENEMLELVKLGLRRNRSPEDYRRMQRYIAEGTVNEVAERGILN